MIENWLSILSDEERNIIQLHLIDGKSWKRIEAEYEQKDEYEYRATRTLMRYQQQALKKIEAINEQIPKSAQTPLFTLREHFEQKSLVKHNF